MEDIGDSTGCHCHREPGPCVAADAVPESHPLRPFLYTLPLLVHRPTLFQTPLRARILCICGYLVTTSHEGDSPPLSTPITSVFQQDFILVL